MPDLSRALERRELHSVSAVRGSSLFGSLIPTSLVPTEAQFARPGSGIGSDAPPSLSPTSFFGNTFGSFFSRSDKQLGTENTELATYDAGNPFPGGTSTAMSDPELIAKQTEALNKEFDVDASEQADCTEACQKARNDVLSAFQDTDEEENDNDENVSIGVGNGLNSLTSAVSTSPDLNTAGGGFPFDFGGIFRFFSGFG